MTDIIRYRLSVNPDKYKRIINPGVYSGVFYVK